MPGKKVTWLSAIALCEILITYSARAEAPPSGDQINEANSPLTPKITVNFQDQWAPTLFDSNADTNAVLLRGVMPHLLGGAPQILRATLPVVTAPEFAGSNVTGLGDLNLFDVFLFKGGGMEFGVGPQLTLPTATDRALGTGKWQAGLAGIAIKPEPWGLLGSLVTWQHSFAGDSDRVTQSNLAVQPFLLFNLPQGAYLRSTATWNFDLARGTYVIPLGAGFGKVWVLSTGTTINAFVEPQWSLAHDGVGEPKFQVFAGLNLQFPIGKKP